jgi:phosphoglycerate dehydrogenase-like enzyme
MSTFRVGITRDLAGGVEPGGWLATAQAEVLDPLSRITCDLFPDDLPEITPALVQDFDAVITGSPKWTEASLQGAERLTLIARWGAGVDEVDLSAATAADVLVATSPAPGNQAAVAESVLAFILALSKHLLAKDRLTKHGRPDEAQQLSGSLIKDRVIGIVGLGGTGSLLAEFVRPLRPARVLAYDPYASAQAAERLGVELTDLQTVMGESDYVTVMCSLTEETRHLVGAELLSLMKPSAYLLNSARGSIVDQQALIHALREKRIAGAALDVFDPEPPIPGDPILEFEDVITTAHAIAWTTESLYECSLEACHAVATVYRGGEPTYVANADVLRRPGFREKLSRHLEARGLPHGGSPS